MASGLVPLANAGIGASGVDFNQELTQAEMEQHIAPPDVYDWELNSQPLEAYFHYAAIEREREANDPRPVPDSPWTVALKRILGMQSKIIHADYDDMPPPMPDNPEARRIGGAESPQDEKAGVKAYEKGSPNGSTDGGQPFAITTLDNERAYRVLRIASWQAVFYLITTDILGFSAAPDSFRYLGYGPGVLTYTFFYLLAVFAGQVIWKLYMSLDSARYPVKCYADLGERVFGRFVRHGFNMLQSTQLLFNVALLIVGNGQTLSVMIEWKFCYLALNIFFMLIGMAGGQIRSLRNFAWFANINIWLNIATMIMTIVGIELYKPAPSTSYHHSLKQPITVTGWVPGYDQGWYQQVVSVQLAVFAYGGAMIFPEFMAEMRRPRDFWKSLLCAQLFCYLAYMFFGLICYSKQGQYSSIIPNVDFQNQALILGNNVINLITIMVAAVLYGNIGVKVFYENVLRAYFKAPPLLSTRGRFYWTLTVCGYWGVAWFLGTAIPNLTALITLVGAGCILQFTYTFPPVLLLGFWMQVDAMKADRPWTPGTANFSNRLDTWRQKSRWARGFKKYWYIKAFLALMFIASCANCILGIYAGIKQAIAGYSGGYNIPFSCYSPNDPAVN